MDELSVPHAGQADGLENESQPDVFSYDHHCHNLQTSANSFIASDPDTFGLSSLTITGMTGYAPNDNSVAAYSYNCEVAGLNQHVDQDGYSAADGGATNSQAYPGQQQSAFQEQHQILHNQTQEYASCSSFNTGHSYGYHDLSLNQQYPYFGPNLQYESHQRSSYHQMSPHQTFAESQIDYQTVPSAEYQSSAAAVDSSTSRDMWTMRPSYDPTLTSRPSTQPSTTSSPFYAGEAYAPLIYKALRAAPGHRMVLRDIYKWFQKHTDKVRNTSENGWQNSIRHNLSMNAAFLKDESSHDDGKRHNAWVLSRDALRRGVQSTTRYRKTQPKKTSNAGHRVSKSASASPHRAAPLSSFSLTTQRKNPHDVVNGEVKSEPISMSAPAAYGQHGMWTYPVYPNATGYPAAYPSNVHYGFQDCHPIIDPANVPQSEQASLPTTELNTPELEHDSLPASLASTERGSPTPPSTVMPNAQHEQLYRRNPYVQSQWPAIEPSTYYQQADSGCWPNYPYPSAHGFGNSDDSQEPQ